MGQSSSKQTKITFHKNHGEDIELSDETAAVRVENRATCWSNGLVFSADPVKPNQKLYVKFVVVSRTCHDVVSVGFTSNDPADVRYSETESENTSWTCTLSKYFCVEDAVVCFHVNSSGTLHYGKANGPQHKVWNKKVDVSRPVWAVVHIWSEPTTVKLVGPNEVRQSVYGGQEEVAARLSGDVGRRVTRDAVTDAAASDDESCTICYVNGVEVVFIPCGHLCACFQCGQTIVRHDNLCPICRKGIGSTVRVYRS
ncbi:E3 ubiquitin-protein ligase NEURL3-like [Zophobas morio]|uniref:E3 ubiquitin-protein ligase NEURL3-like n=1 Tax=Zophobas morio TaxID=2755281 RepID=UPI00308366BC